MAAKKPLEKLTKAELAGRLSKEQLLTAVRQAEMPDGVGYQVSGPPPAPPPAPVAPAPVAPADVGTAFPPEPPQPPA